MILTVTLNASVDITYLLDKFQLGKTNRALNITKTAGGKGLNVTRVLNQVGNKAVATGIIGGTTGSFIKSRLNEQEIKHHFFEIDQESRNNISIITGKLQTEILEAGPKLSSETCTNFLNFYHEIIKDFDTIVVSGSLSQGLNHDYYSKLTEVAVNEGKKLLLDTSGSALKASISSSIKPMLIKPNEHELESLINRKVEVKDMGVLKKYLSMPLFNGIEWIVLTLGSEGALVKHRECFYEVKVPKINAINAIGSGDSVVAGLALGIDQNESTEKILLRSMAYGVLNALDEHSGHLKLDELDAIKNNIIINRV